MIAVIQRVSEASVSIDGQINGQISQGFLVLLGITQTDTDEDLMWLAKKIVGLRIFSDHEGKMNLDDGNSYCKECRNYLHDKDILK